MKEKMKLLMKDYETILYEGKPNTLCTVLEIIFNPLLPFSIIWGLIDSQFIKAILNSNSFDDSMAIFFVIFFTIHLMPVWIYLFGVIGKILKYLKTYYIVTNKSVYISDGDSKRGIIKIPFEKITDIRTYQGLFDKILGVGDVLIRTESQFQKISSTNMISSVSNYNELCNHINNLRIEESKDSTF